MFFTFFENDKVEKNSYKNRVNIISYFIKKGSIKKKHFTITIALIFLGFGLIIALILHSWRFQNNYKS